jgi:predicted unusual protein kinase regulating ubiquinone biosynthesis (AarF/ABC1/UbiB family)
VASASLAQVHRAVLKDGRHVAVKIQRPEIAAAVQTDLRNLRLAVDAIERIEGSLGLRALLAELETQLPRELDFEREARSARALARNFADDPGVRIPAMVDEHCAGRVLVSDYISGTKVTDTRRLRRLGVDPEQVARRLLDAYARQILRHRLFHADPHPGNLLVVAGPEDFALAFVDFGLVQEVPESFRADALALAAAALAGDAPSAAAALRALGIETEAGGGDTLGRVAELLVEGVRRRREANGRAGTADLGEALMAALRADPLLRMPAHLWLIGRVLGLLRGIWNSLGQPQQLAQGLMPYLVDPA